MPKPYKLQRPYHLPAGAILVDVDGRPHVRTKDERGRSALFPVSKDGTKYLKPSKRWYFDIRDGRTVRRVKGFADLKATEQLAAQMERRASRKRVGIIDPTEDHLCRPLTDHLADYGAFLESKGDTLQHVRKTKATIASLVNGCGFVLPLDADAGKAAEWLNELRRDPAPIELPEGDDFPPGNVAKLFGITPTGLAKTVRRLGLEPATGQGKARRYPRSTIEAVAIHKAKGRGPETINHYVRAVRGFFRWLVKAKRIGSNPLESLSLVNAAVDVRRARRELNADELRRLFVAARDSSRTFRGLNGRDRFTLYLVAAGTGFRASALANLTPTDFDLDSPSPCVTLPARFAKNRRTKVQPVPLDVADALRGYLADRPVNAPIWGGTWASGCAGAEMIRRDLDAAGIPYAVEGPDGTEYADFHSLRHSYLTLGGRSGIDLRTLQELAGHSTPTLTARYSHRRLHDVAGAVEKLPDLVPTTTPEAVRMTGTDPVSGVVPGVVPGVVNGRAEPHSPASIGIFPDERGGQAEVKETAKKTRAGADSHRPALFSINGACRIRTDNQAIMSRLL